MTGSGHSYPSPEPQLGLGTGTATPGRLPPALNSRQEAGSPPPTVPAPQQGGNSLELSGLGCDPSMGTLGVLTTGVVRDGHGPPLGE